MKCHQKSSCFWNIFGDLTPLTFGDKNLHQNPKTSVKTSWFYPLPFYHDMSPIAESAAIGGILAWWARRWISMPEVVGSIPAQMRLHSNTLRQGMNPWLLPDCTKSGSMGVQNVQHLEILHWRFGGVGKKPEIRLKPEDFDHCFLKCLRYKSGPYFVQSVIMCSSFHTEVWGSMCSAQTESLNMDMVSDIQW